jgi:hypothetical protein
MQQKSCIRLTERCLGSPAAAAKPLTTQSRQFILCGGNRLRRWATFA